MRWTLERQRRDLGEACSRAAATRSCRSRCRRSRIRGIARLPMLLLWALLLSGCMPGLSGTSHAPIPRPGNCRPTIAHMTPPSEVLEFYADKASMDHESALAALKAENWYGNEAMWVILPRDGEIVGRLDEKIPHTG